MKKHVPESLVKLVENTLEPVSLKVEPIAQSGSPRQYFRFTDAGKSVIGAFSENTAENRAFLTYQQHFKGKGLRVPAVIAVSDDMRSWLLEDLGDVSLYSLIPANGVQPDDEALIKLYRQVIKDLIAFQIDGHKGLDYSVAYPRKEFDRRSLSWDLNYFKYYFLKLHTEDFDEDVLQDGFDILIEAAMQADRNFFMYRDFQSRNILIKDKKPWYIDFQGGRKGPLAYDLVSLLYQSRANIHPAVREQLIEEYLNSLNELKPVDSEGFRNEIKLFALIRTLQVLGAYGFRGIIQHRKLFLKSIPQSLQNLEELIPWAEKKYGITEFGNILKKMVEVYPKEKNKAESPLKVKVVSFSFLKAGVPEDPSGHGGGHVFDCRALPNPGRYEQYKHLTGLDKEVKDFLKPRTEVDQFIENALSIITQSVEVYIDRGFEHLMIGFGCTGGQHRSVYCAEEVAARLKQMYNIEVITDHYQKSIGY